MKLSSQYSGIALQLKNGFCQSPCQLSSFLTSSCQHFGYGVRWASSLAAFHLPECFVDQGCRHTGRWDSSWSDLGVFVAWPLKFNIEQPSIVPSSCHSQAHQHHCIHNSLQQGPGLCGPSVWQYEKHHHPLGILWRIPLLLTHMLPTRQHAFWRTWCQCRKFLPSLASAMMPPFFRALCALNRACFSCIPPSICSFHHQVSDFHMWFLKKPQTVVAAPSRESFIFDQADSTGFAVSASSPVTVPTAAIEIIVLTWKDNWNWLALAGSLSFLVRMQGENSRFSF